MITLYKKYPAKSTIYYRIVFLCFNDNIIYGLPWDCFYSLVCLFLWHLCNIYHQDKDLKRKHVIWMALVNVDILGYNEDITLIAC
jgi:hypothetical protein